MCKFPIIDMEKTGKNIVEMRQKKGLSVKEIQVMFGFETPQAIYKWQHGKTLPSVDNLVALATIFEVSVDEILVMSDEYNISA